MSILENIIHDLQSSSDPSKVNLLGYFFKTEKGQYAQGDKFIAVTVPRQRQISRLYYKKATFDELDILIQNEIHEYRLTALLILILKYQKLAKSKEEKTEIVDFYLSHLNNVNNWDLVDVSASHILGAYLYDRPRDVLYELASSGDLWKQRISIIATMYFIKFHDFGDSIHISKLLITHKHDLIHKAVGWVLREIGKKDRLVLDTFLREYYHQMPRTMLRYAIEKHDEPTRKSILKGDWS